MSDIGIPYMSGLADLGDGCYAWLVPPGSWGLANSGFVVGSNDVLVVDTQNDMRLAGALLDAVKVAGHRRRVETVVNTHSDSDHWSGNLLFPDARIVASDACLHEMTHMWLNQDRLAELARGDRAFARWIRWRTETFDYAGWQPSYPTNTFSGERSLDVADRQVGLIEVGPAHTAGDIIVHLPENGIVFAGDILFTESTPMVWAGPIERCIAACETIMKLEPRYVVPGHGPIVGTDGVRQMRDYLHFVNHVATAAYESGRTPDEAYRDLDLGPYKAWTHASRVYHTIKVVYRGLDPQRFAFDRINALDTVLADDDGDWRARDV